MSRAGKRSSPLNIASQSSDGRRDRWLCVLCIAVLWMLISLPTVFYAIPYEENLKYINGTLDSYTLALLHKAGIQAVTEDVLHLLQLVQIQFQSVLSQGAVAQEITAASLLLVLQQPCGESHIRNKAGVCVPNCLEWSLYDSDVHMTEDAFLAVGFAVGIISGLIVIITWTFVRKMWKFPHVLPFYMNICACLSVFFLCLTDVVGRPGCFCSSKDLTVALRSTTTVCNIQGSLAHFFSHAAILWWMFSAVNLFVGICCPLSTFAGRLFSDQTRLHIMESLVSWTVPLMLVITVHGVDQYYPTLGPDTIGCTPRSRSLHYFTQALPIQIFLGIGLTLIIRVVFALKEHARWEMERQNAIMSPHSALSRRSSIKKQRNLANLEKRFIFIYVTYPICMAAILITVIIQLRDVENFENSFRNYLLCEALQLPLDNCRSFLRSTHPELSLCALVAFIAYCVFALPFSMAAKPIRAFWYEQSSKLSCERGEYIVKDTISRSPTPQAVETDRNQMEQLDNNGEVEEVMLQVTFENSFQRESSVSNA